MPIVLGLALVFAAERAPNAVVVAHAVLAAPRTVVERALMDVAAWPEIFRDIERVEGVRRRAGCVTARVTSKTTGLRHDVEVRRDRRGILWRVDDSKGLVAFTLREEEGVTHLSVDARTHIHGPMKVVLSDPHIEATLRAVVRSDLSDLGRRFGTVDDEHVAAE